MIQKNLNRDKGIVSMSKMIASGNVIPPAKSSQTFLRFILLFILVIIFFCMGVFIGSRTVSVHNFGVDTGTSSSSGEIIVSGLPRTHNILDKWIDKKPSLRANHLTNPIVGTFKTPATAIPQTTLMMGKLPSIVKHEESHEISKRFETLRKSSLHARKDAYASIMPILDDANVMINVWIYLESSSLNDKDMRTIFSNKLPGCGVESGQHGISLYINGWQSLDHKLYFEYGGLKSGCNKLTSLDQTLLTGHWYHLSVYSGEKLSALYIDGKLVNSVIHSVTDEPHAIQNIKPTNVGQYQNGEYPFYGNISHMTVFHNFIPTSNDPIDEITQTVKDIKHCIETFDGKGIIPIKNLENAVINLPKRSLTLVAFYPFVDASGEDSDEGVVANDYKQLWMGEYHFPMKTVTGLSTVHIKLNDGLHDRGAVTEAMIQADLTNGKIRRDAVKNGMIHAWSGYKKYAWGFDELKPLSNRGQDNWGGMGVTLVDSLDTLWIMGLMDEFHEAKQWVEKSLTFSRAGTVSVFETTIRELGGLLSAYDLSGEQVFLTKAMALADLLLPAFNTRSGIPSSMVNFKSGSGGSGWSGSNAILSELGSLQIEFRYLAHHSKKLMYETKSMVPLQLMHRLDPSDGLYPIYISIDSAQFGDSQFTLGALGDSFYEYLLKVWIQGGKKETWLREMYDKAINGIVDKLLLSSDMTGLAFFADWNGRNNNRKMDHLVCFMPGILALGAYTDPKGLDSPRARRDLSIAKALMYTCREMYHRMPSGISPEYVEFPANRDMVPAAGAPFYILRPETAESLFVLHQLTGDPIYGDWAWEIWQAIDSNCRTNTAYGALSDVQQKHSSIDDRMESFFLAETLKYLYLAVSPEVVIDLTKYVFNTEAHPTRIFDDTHSPISEQ